MSPDFNFTVSSTAPAVFLNGTDGLSTNLPSVTRAANGLLVTPSNPIHQGDSLTIFAAGLGLTSPAVAAGAVSPANLRGGSAQPTVTLNGVALPMTFAGLVPGQIGVYEIQVNVPTYTPQGLSVPLIITQNGRVTDGGRPGSALDIWNNCGNRFIHGMNPKTQGRML